MGFHSTVANKSVGIITVPGGQAVPTELVAVDVGNVAVGELLYVTAFACLIKGNAGGDNLVLIRSIDSNGAPDGKVLFGMDTIDLEDRRFVPAAAGVQGKMQAWLSGVGCVVTAGPLRLSMRASSAASDSTAYQSWAQLRVYRIS